MTFRKSLLDSRYEFMEKIQSAIGGTSGGYHFHHAFILYLQYFYNQLFIYSTAIFGSRLGELHQ